MSRIAYIQIPEELIGFVEKLFHAYRVPFAEVDHETALQDFLSDEEGIVSNGAN